MDIAKTRCANCHQLMRLSSLTCPDCNISLQGSFDLPPLARLSAEDQIFVSAFVRHHGSIKKMEELFDVSYPTVKNRLNAIGAQLDKNFQAPSSNAATLEQLARGEITVDQALERLGHE